MVKMANSCASTRAGSICLYHPSMGGTWLTWYNKHSLAVSKSDNEVRYLCGSSAAKHKSWQSSEFLSLVLLPWFASSGAHRFTLLDI